MKLELRFHYWRTRREI